MRVKTCAFLCLMAAGVANTHAQVQFKDAGALLVAVEKVYAADAETFHFESVTERVSKDEWQRSWEKEIRVAIKAPKGRFRIESRSGYGTWIQISDGTTEWVYLREGNTYAKRAAGSEPQFPKIFLPGMQGLREAWNTRISLEGDAMHASNATLLAEETILLGGHSYPCYVVHATDSGKGFNSDNTFWIEKKTLLFRKIVRQTQSMLMLSQNLKIPRAIKFTTTYPVAELRPQLEPATFAFAPPPDAKETATFEPDIHGFTPPPAAQATGQLLPDLSLTSAEGKEVKLASFRGRPLLIDLWATWCAPCLEGMPLFGRLAKEMQGKGLEVISVDRDERAETATRYMSAHGFSWLNYHDPEGKLGSALGQKGIPLTILINAEGRITYMSNDRDETALRKAIAALNLPDGRANP